MFRSVISNRLSIIALIAITLTGIQCHECKDHETACHSLEELTKEQNCFETWAKKKCPNNQTVLEQKEIDDYKVCIKTHLEPCLQAKEDEVFLKMFTGMFQDESIDMCHVCQESVQKKIEDKLIDIYVDHKELMDKRAKDKCSMIKQAMHEVMVCGKIED